MLACFLLFLIVEMEKGKRLTDLEGRPVQVLDRGEMQYSPLHGDGRTVEESKGVGPSVGRKKGNSRKVERENDDEDSWNGAS